MQLSAVLCALTALVAAAEYTQLSELTDVGGLLDDRVHRRGILRVPGGLRCVIGVQAAIAVALGASALVGSVGAVAAAAGMLLVFSVSLGLSLPWGRDGADEMTIVAAAGTAVIAAGLAADIHAVAVAGAWFLTAVLCVSYFASGAAKLGGAEWRTGRALSLIMQTRSYGHARVAALLRQYRNMGVAATYVMMAGEMAFPTALVTPAIASIAILVCGVGFHLLTAVLVRLNRFVPAFLASYPPMLWVIVHR